MARERIGAAAGEPYRFADARRQPPTRRRARRPHTHCARRRARRRLVLAARAGQPRGARVPPTPRTSTPPHAWVRPVAPGPSSSRRSAATCSETDVGAPIPWGPWAYFAAHHRGSPVRPALPRSARRDTGRRRRRQRAHLLDENELADGHDYFWLGDLEISPDHSVAAYIVDFNGGERYSCTSATSRPAAMSTRRFPTCTTSLAWSADSRTVFYARPDEAMRPFEVWRHTLRHAGVRRRARRTARTTSASTRGCTPVAAASTSSSAATHAHERGLAAACRRTRRRTRVWWRRVYDGVEYGVDHRGDDLVIWSNVDGKTNFELFRAPVATPGRESWTTLVPHDPAVRLAQSTRVP